MTLIPRELRVASEICGRELADLITFIEQIDPELQRYQATMVAAQILNQLPQQYQSNLQMFKALKKACRIAKSLNF